MSHEEVPSIVLENNPSRNNVKRLSSGDLGRQGEDDVDNATAITTMSWSAYTSNASGSCDLSVDDASSTSSVSEESRSKSLSHRSDDESSGISTNSQITFGRGAPDIEHRPPLLVSSTASKSLGESDNDQGLAPSEIREKGQRLWNNDALETLSKSIAMTELNSQTRKNSYAQSVCGAARNEDIQQKSKNGSVLPTSGKLAYVEDCIRGKSGETESKFTLPDHSVASESATPEALIDLEAMVASNVSGFHRPGAYIVHAAIAPLREPPLILRAAAEPSAYLVEASLVSDAPSESEAGAESVLDNVFEAKPIEEKSLWTSRKIQCAVFWIVILTSGAAVGITIGLMMKTPQAKQSAALNQDTAANQSSWEPETSPTREPQATDFIKELQSILPLGTAIALKNEDSPQFKAFQWIRQHPPGGSDSLERTTQRFALATLFLATNGMNWDDNNGWLNVSSHECDWFMSSSTETDRSCDVAEESIVALRLVQNSLEGTIPSEIALLKSLRTIQLELNPLLVGEIPEAIMTSAVTEMHLNENSFTGVLPDLNSNTTVFLASENSLAGKLPDSFAHLSRLDMFSVASNKLSGRFAEEIFSQWLMATSIDVSDNQFTGSISKSIGLLNSLTTLSLNTNNFTGPVPTELGQLTGLHELLLGENGFSGPIPSEIAAARRLQVLDLETNLLTGTIPTELQLLTDLQELRLGANALVGTLPEGFMSLKHAHVLSFGQNSLNGTIPTDASLQSSVQILSLHHNQFTGLIPDFNNFSSIIELRLNSNNLTGTLPGSLGFLRSLEVLDLEDNRLSGTIPSSLGSLESIQEMILSGNRFNGTVPVEICTLIKANKAKVEIDCDRVVCDCGCTCCGTSHSNATT